MRETGNRPAPGLTRGLTADIAPEVPGQARDSEGRN